MLPFSQFWALHVMVQTVLEPSSQERDPPPQGTLQLVHVHGVSGIVRISVIRPISIPGKHMTEV